MFENLSDREKKLLLGVGALVPITILFLFIFQMTGSFKENKQQLESLDMQIADQKELELEGMLAGRRQNYYANSSLHPSINIASNDYGDWLKTTIEDAGMAWTAFNPTPGSRIRSGDQTIGESKIFKITASGTLPQFNEFLSKFYQKDILHRITQITLTPQNDGRSTKPVRDGFLSAKFTFEALSLASGKNRESFDEFRTNLVNKEKDYQAILRRNIFGPANSEPVLKVSDKKWTTGKKFSTSFTANDANKNDLLTFELVESSVEKASLGPQKETDRRVKFEMPDMPPGEYSFKIKTKDNGFPPKFSIEEFVVTVNEPRKETKTVVKTKEPEPEVDYIRLVKVTGFKPDRDGKRRVWVSIGHTGERKRLAVGEMLDLGDKKYEVVSIKKNEATFVGDGKTYIATLDYASRGELIDKETFDKKNAKADL